MGKDLVEITYEEFLALPEGQKAFVDFGDENLVEVQAVASNSGETDMVFISASCEKPVMAIEEALLDPNVDAIIVEKL